MTKHDVLNLKCDARPEAKNELIRDNLDDGKHVTGIAISHASAQHIRGILDSEKGHPKNAHITNDRRVLETIHVLWPTPVGPV